jgi:hypothetical protein
LNFSKDLEKLDAYAKSSYSDRTPNEWRVYTIPVTAAFYPDDIRKSIVTGHAKAWACMLASNNLSSAELVSTLIKSNLSRNVDTMFADPNARAVFISRGDDLKAFRMQDQIQKFAAIRSVKDNNLCNLNFFCQKGSRDE